MTNEQVLTLLYLEDRAVNDCGWIDSRDLDDSEIEQIRQWHSTQYLTYSDDRVCLSYAAWKDAAKFRRERAARGLLLEDLI
jgi:hypothetical protein